ncbi:MAG: hypothetical protein JWP01_1510 [Myxococcales bacterium]|nr:hypothetical protein [Myxococcales bacterium]
MVELAYGRDRAASELAGFATLADACASDLLVPDDARRSTLVALQRHVDTGGGPVPVLRGPEGSGRRALISTLAHELGARVLVVRCGALPERLGPALTAITREATLAGAVIVIADAELLAADPGTGRPDRTGALHAAFTGYAGPLAITMAHEASPANLMPLRAVGARTVVFMRPSVTNVSHTTSWSLRAAISAHWMETDTWSVWTSAAMTESPRVTKPH